MIIYKLFLFSENLETLIRQSKNIEIINKIAEKMIDEGKNIIIERNEYE